MDNKVSSADYPSGGEKAVWDAGGTKFSLRTHLLTTGTGVLKDNCFLL